MANKYIGYLQLENLLMKYDLIQGLTDSLKAELKAFVEHGSNEDERLLAMALGNRPLYTKDVPMTSTPEPGKRMTGIISSYHDVIANEDQQAIREILLDFRTVQAALQKLDNAFKCLTGVSAQIVYLHYFQGRTWDQTTRAITKSDRQCRNIKQQAIETLAKVCRISLVDYGRIMELVEGVE